MDANFHRIETPLTDSMYKILCLIDGLTLGGAERQLIGLASLLGQKGYKVELAYYHQKCFYDELIHEKRIQTRYIDTGKSRLGKFYHVYRFVTKGKYDVVICFKRPNVIACAAKLFGARFKLIVSDRNTNQKLSIEDRLMFFMYRWADYVVPNSFSQREFICTHFSRLISKTVVITNFTDTKHFTPSGKNANGHPLRVLTVARMAKQKNVANYLYAIKQVTDQRHDVIFEWYGDVQPGEEDYWQECCELVEKLNVNEFVSFHPSTTNIADVYRDCDVFCLPSLFEGYPNALCEAMSCGKPVLCSRVCDNPQIVEEGQNALLFTPDDVDDISKIILKMLSLSREERYSMGQKSRLLAEERFSEEVFVKKYIRLIEDNPSQR